MKVAVVVRSLKIGGMERVAISLTKAFQDEGHDSHLIYFKKKKESYNIDEIINVHYWNLDKILAFSVIGLFYNFFFRILNIIFRHSYPISRGFITSYIFKNKLSKLEKNSTPFDLIIIRGQGTFEFLWFNQDKRYVQVCENLLYPGDKMNFFTKIYAKLLYQNKNIVCVSSGVLESFQSLESKVKFRSKQSIVITNPINVNNINKYSQEYIPNIEEPYIVNVGRLAPVKQLPLLIESFFYAKNKYNIPHKLVLVGQGHDEENIRNKIISLKLENDVILTGVQINPYPWIKHAKLFVLSSKHEGLGMVLLEALACETNLVVTKSQGGVIDIMKNELQALLCEPNIEILGEKILKELNNPSYIDFNKHLKPFLANNIINQYIHTFLHVSISTK